MGLTLLNLVLRWGLVLPLLLHLQMGHLYLPDLIPSVCHSNENGTKMMCQIVPVSH